ncbi:DNA topoisomerase IV [Xanthomarina sp. F1114]|uniref:DNA topoisomerase IV n=1 Tax=Xanthomarina sp. F1114 TaxID=2996019 RepID=UPI00225DF242|nr:DNA topoisomerase IV [Xanthomarina sp. F1114]MCX7548061.1 DNA topoisomerase IV [Xanthomarina sp. F1114]
MKYFSAIIFMIMLTSCYQVERNCLDFQTGTFFSEITIDGEVFKSEFVRTKDLQIETYNNKVDSTHVRWINDCEVIFKTINPKNMAEHKDIHLKILVTTDSTYTFEYSYVGEKNKQKGIATKVK